MDYSDEIESIKKELSRIQTQISNNLADLDKETKSYAKTWADVGKQISANFSPIARTEQSIGRLNKELEISVNAQKSYEAQLENIQNKKQQLIKDVIRYNELLDKSNKSNLSQSEVEELNNLEEIYNKRRDISKSLKAQERYTNTQLQNQKGIQTTLEGQLDAQQQQLSVLNLIKDTYSKIVALYKKGLDVYKEYEEFLSKQVKISGITKQQLQAQLEEIRKINVDTEINSATTLQILESQIELSKEYALGVKYTKELGKSISQTAKSTGLTNDESTKLIGNLAQVGSTSLKSQKNMAGFAIEVAKANDVPLDVLLKDIVNLSSTVKVVFKGNTFELIKQAAELRKMGSSLESAAKSAESLLNFESSIGAELKASALLGKTVNFNQSRRLFFQGKTLEGEKALVNELQRVGDLNKLNIFQRKALADATGKSYDELLKIQTQRENQLEIERKFPERAAELRKLQEQVNKLQGTSAERREKELENILKQQEAESRIALLNQARQAALARIADVLKPIYDTVVEIQITFYNWITNLDKTSATLVGIGAVMVPIVATVGLLLGKFVLLSKIAPAIGGGIGKGLMGVAGGIRALGRAGIAAAAGLPVIGGYAAVIGLLAIAIAGAVYLIKDPLKIFIDGLTKIYEIVTNFLLSSFDKLIDVFKSIPTLLNESISPLIKLVSISAGLPLVAAGLASLAFGFGTLTTSLFLFPVNKFAKITNQLIEMGKVGDGIKTAVGAIKELNGLDLPEIKIDLKNADALAKISENKDNSTQEIKEGLTTVANKIDNLTNLLASGGIAINLDGQKLNSLLQQNTYKYGVRGLSTKTA